MGYISEEKVSRRKYLGIAGGAVVAGAVGGALGVYYLTQPPTPPLEKETVTVWTFPIGDPEKWEAHFEPMKEEIEALNPDVEVVFETYPWGGRDARMITAAAGGVAPDICYLNTRHIAKLSHLGALQHVDDLLPQEYLEDAVPSLIEAYSWDDHVWAGVNLVSTPYVWVYNPDIFADSGITNLPNMDNPWSWEDMTNAAIKLKENGYYIGWPTQPSVVFFVRPSLQQAGVDICREGKPWSTDVMFDNPEGVSFFRWYGEMWYEHEAAHPSLVGGEIGPLINELFATEELGLIYGVDTGWVDYMVVNAPDVPWEVGGVMYNQQAGKEHMAVDVVPGMFGVFKQTHDKHPEATKAVYQWLMSPEGIEMWCKEYGFSSPYQSQEGWLEGTEIYDKYKLADWLPWAQYGYPEWGNHPAANDIYHIFWAEISACCLGEKTPEQACADAAEAGRNAMESAIVL